MDTEINNNINVAPKDNTANSGITIPPVCNSIPSNKYGCNYIIKKGGFILEVKVNKEIRNYTESIYFGLSLRQFIFSVLACLMAVVLYFILKPYFGLETLSWMCIISVTPFAALGFITYNGMNAEQIVWAWIKCEVLMPREIKMEHENLYWELLKQYFINKEKEELKRDKNPIKHK